MRRTRLAWLGGLALLVAACGADDDTGESSDDLLTSGDQCVYGSLGIPAFSLGLGPLQVGYDIETGDVSVTVGGSIPIGPLSLGLSEQIVSEPTCFTLELIDRRSQRRHLIALDRGGDEVRLTGSGTLSQILTNERLQVDVTEMCRLAVFAEGEDVPEVGTDCGALMQPFYVVQFGAFRQGGELDRIEELDELGVTGLQAYLSDTWASNCQGHVVVWSRRFDTSEDAAQYLSSLPADIGPVIGDEPWVKRVSNSVDDRGQCPDA